MPEALHGTFSELAAMYLENIVTSSAMASGPSARDEVIFHVHEFHACPDRSCAEARGGKKGLAKRNKLMMAQMERDRARLILGEDADEPEEDTAGAVYRRKQRVERAETGQKLEHTVRAGSMSWNHVPSDADQCINSQYSRFPSHQIDSINDTKIATHLLW